MKLKLCLLAGVLVLAGCGTPSTPPVADSKTPPATTADATSTGSTADTTGGTVPSTSTSLPGANPSAVMPPAKGPAGVKPPAVPGSGAMAVKPGAPSKMSAPLTSAVKPQMASSAPVPAGSYLLRLSPKSAEAFDYKITTQGPTPTGKMGTYIVVLNVSYSPASKGQVTRVTQIKSVDLSSVISSVPPAQKAQVMKYLAAQEAGMKKLKSIETVDPNGKNSSTKMEGLPAGAKGPAAGSQSLSSIIFPDKAVKIGDTWQSPLGAQEVTCKLEKVVSQGAQQIAVVKITGAVGKQSAQSDQIFRYDIKDGTLVSASSKVSAPGPTGKPINMTVEIKRS